MDLYGGRERVACTSQNTQDAALWANTGCDNIDYTVNAILGIRRLQSECVLCVCVYVWINTISGGRYQWSLREFEGKNQTT